MSNLTDIYNQISSHDAELLEKQAEQIKLAEEEDAAGRIMARGFADELHKIAGGGMQPPPGPAQTAKPIASAKGPTVPTGAFRTGGGKTAPGKVTTRKPFAPPTAKSTATAAAPPKPPKMPGA